MKTKPAQGCERSASRDGRASDHLLNAMAWANPQAIYNLMFKAAWQSLKAFGRKYLGGEIGGTAVLHTWGETLIEVLSIDLNLTLLQDEWVV